MVAVLRVGFNSDLLPDIRGRDLLLKLAGSEPCAIQVHGVALIRAPKNLRFLLLT